MGHIWIFVTLILLRCSCSSYLHYGLDHLIEYLIIIYPNDLSMNGSYVTRDQEILKNSKCIVISCNKKLYNYFTDKATRFQPKCKTTNYMNSVLVNNQYVNSAVTILNK